MKSFYSLALAVVVAFVSACGGDSPTDPTPTPPPATTGTISGTVNLAPGLNIDLTNARVAIYSSIQDWDADRFVAQAGLVGQSPNWTYSLSNVTPGTYYLDVCVLPASAANCVPYRAAGSAQPSPFSVAAGQTATISFQFIR